MTTPMVSSGATEMEDGVKVVTAADSISHNLVLLPLFSKSRWIYKTETLCFTSVLVLSGFRY